MIALRNLPLVLVSIIMNMVPLVTAVLGYLILKERLQNFEKVCLLFSFVGVAIMITGRDSEKQVSPYPLFALIAIILNPFFSSIVIITLRNMRNLPAHTQAFYHALTSVVIFGLVILFT